LQRDKCKNYTEQLKAARNTSDLVRGEMHWLIDVQ